MLIDKRLYSTSAILLIDKRLRNYSAVPILQSYNYTAQSFKIITLTPSYPLSQIVTLFFFSIDSSLNYVTNLSFLLITKAYPAL
jgi:hypothetical protein